MDDEYDVDAFEAEAGKVFWEIVPQLPIEMVLLKEDVCPTCGGVKGDHPDYCPTCAHYVGTPIFD